MMEEEHAFGSDLCRFIYLCSMEKVVSLIKVFYWETLLK